MVQQFNEIKLFLDILKSQANVLLILVFSDILIHS